MRKIKLMIIVGILIAILPYLGFPFYIKNVLFTILGLLVIFLAYSIKLRASTKEKETKNENESYDNFSESTNINDQENQTES